MVIHNTASKISETRDVLVKHYAPNYMLVDTKMPVEKVQNSDKSNPKITKT